MFSSIDEVLADLRLGKMVILTDDEDRENEGDLVLPAQFASPETITFMLSVARGYMCLSLTEADCDRLDLSPQAAVNTSSRGTAFTISIDGHSKHGFTTGVSAKERARTIQMCIDPKFGPADFVRPGHINPLRSRDGGVLVRIGQTEGSIDLCRGAGLYPAAIIIEIMHDDGEMARLPQLNELARRHNLKMCSVRQIIEHRLSRSTMVTRLAPHGGRTIRTREGEFTLFAFRSVADPLPHLALTAGGVGLLSSDGTPIETPEPTLVRVHRRDLMGDVFLDLDSSPAGATGSTLRTSMRMIQEAGRGAIVYLRPQWAEEDWRRQLQTPFDSSDEDKPHKSVPPSMVEYGTGSQILRALGLSKLRLMTNSHADYPKLDAFGLQIVERVGVGQGG